MKKAILAKKIGMTEIFDDAGNAVAVTVLQAGPCTVIAKKNSDKDGYTAVQVGFEPVEERKLNQPQLGHFAKAGVAPHRYLREFRLEDTSELEVGDQIKVDIFSPGDLVDVGGITRGKGFAGSIKRHGQHRGPMSHGSHYHRGPGALGSVDAARVFKGRKLPGRMGGDTVTVQKLKVVSIDPEKNIILVKGAVPGPRKGVLLVTDSSKAGAR